MQEEVTARVEKRGLVCALVMLISAGGLMATDLYLPSLPAVAAYFQASPSLVQLSISVFLFGFGGFQLLFGPLSDRFGRRPILLMGFSLYALGSIVCVFSVNITMLLIGRFIQGMGIAGGNALSRVILRDLFDGKQLAKVASYLATIICLTPALAPVLGGYLEQSFGFRSNFLFLLLYGLLVLGLIYYLLPETNIHKNTHIFKRGVLVGQFRKLLSCKQFVISMFCSGLGVSGLISYAVINPFLMQTILGLSPAGYGEVTFIISLGLVLGIFMNSQLVSILGTRRMIQSGAFLMLIAGAGLLVLVQLGFASLVGIIAINTLFAAGVGFILPNATATALHPFPKMAGVAGAAFGCTQILLTGVSSVIIAAIPQHNAFVLSMSFLIIGALAVIISRFLDRPI